MSEFLIECLFSSWSFIFQTLCSQDIVEVAYSRRERILLFIVKPLELKQVQFSFYNISILAVPQNLRLMFEFTVDKLTFTSFQTDILQGSVGKVTVFQVRGVQF